MITNTYYLVRHAEKQDPTDPDTPISANGKIRAEALKNILKNKDIGHIIVSEFIRTQQTAKPLEAEIHRSHTIIEHDDISKVIRSLQRYPVVLVVGHTSNIPAIIKKITGDIVNIDEADFSNLFIITIKQFLFFKFKKLTRSHYGVPSR